MHNSLLALAATVSVASAVSRGFNYGAVTRTGAVKTEADFNAEFSAAQALPGTDGAFSSARLYTTIQAGTPNSPISAIPAAIASNTRLFLGLWASSGQQNIDNEIAALTSAIEKYGTKFTSLVNGISVGSEDLYRISPTGLSNDPLGVGAQPSELVNYIKQVKTAIAGTSLSSAPVGHVDTWDVWRNGSNAAVIAEADFLGMNTFPYFQTTQDNSIDNAAELFDAAYQITVNAANGKPVFVTETGWPVRGENSAAAEPSTENARKYYEAVGCNTLFGKVDTYWYTLVDANTDTATQPQFGVVGTTVSTNPLYDLSCSASSNNTSSSTASSSGTAAATGGSAVATASGTASGIVSGTSAISTATGVVGESSTTVVVSSSAPIISLAPEGGSGRPSDNSTNVIGNNQTTVGAGPGATTPTAPGTGSSPSPTAVFDGSASGLKASTAGILGAVAAFMAFF